MDDPKNKVVSMPQWIEARKEFLEKEKEFTRRRDELSAERQKLPWMKIGKEYVFAGDDGPGQPSESGHCQRISASVNLQSPGLFRHSSRIRSNAKESRQ